MSGGNNGGKVMGWITLIFLIVFFIIGIGIVSGLFFPDRIFPNAGLRTLLGLLLIGYSLIRGIFVYKNLKA